MVGVRAAQVCDELVAVGKLGKMIADSALQSRLLPHQVKWFPTVPESIEYLKNHLKEGDIVLLKGSRGLRMERIAAALEEVR